jgi:hypothetical protein
MPSGANRCSTQDDSGKPSKRHKHSGLFVTEKNVLVLSTVELIGVNSLILITKLGPFIIKNFI